MPAIHLWNFFKQVRKRVLFVFDWEILDNVTKEEQQATHNFAEDRLVIIIIRPGDKGSFGVNWDIEYYLAEGYKQLHSTYFDVKKCNEKCQLTEKTIKSLRACVIRNLSQKKRSDIFHTPLRILISHPKFTIDTLRKMCPNTEFFLVHIFPYSVQIRENTDQEKLCIWTFFAQ